MPHERFLPYKSGGKLKKIMQLFYVPVVKYNLAKLTTAGDVIGAYPRGSCSCSVGAILELRWPDCVQSCSAVVFVPLPTPPCFPLLLSVTGAWMPAWGLVAGLRDCQPWEQFLV